MLKIVFENQIPLLLLLTIFLLLSLSLLSYRRLKGFLVPGFNSLIIFRTLSFLLLLFLLTRPYLLLSSRSKPRLAVLIDSSESMSLKERELPQGRLITALSIFKELYPELKKFFITRIYTFSSSPQPVNLSELEKIKPMGKETFLIQSLKEVCREDKPQAILILSDGIDNQSPPPAQELKEFPLPIYSIGVGGKGRIPDIKIERVEGDRELSPEEEREFLLRVLNEGGKRKVKVSFYKDSELREEKEVELEEGENVISFSFSSPEEGVFTLKFKIEPFPEEKITYNNEKFISVKVVRKKIYVLLVGGRLSWEARGIKRILESDPSFSLDFYLKAGQGIFSGTVSEPYKELDKYHLILLIQTPFSLLPEVTKLKEWVSKGGGLIIIGGKDSFLTSSLSPLWKELLPLSVSVQGVKWERGYFYPSFAPESLHHPIFEGLSKYLKIKLPPLKGYLKFPKRKAGTIPLLYDSGRRNQFGNFIVCAFQRYGEGKVFLLASPSTWRWSLDKSLPKDFYPSFWLSILHYLSPSQILKQGKGILVYSDKDEYKQGEKVRIEALVLEKGGVSPELEGFVERKGKRKRLDFIEWKKGQWEAVVGLKEEGVYTYRVRSKFGEKKGMFLYGNPWKEWERLRLNEDLLRRISMVSGGKFFSLEEVNKDIVRKIQVKGEGERKLTLSLPLPFYILLLLLISGELILRKRANLP